MAKIGFIGLGVMGAPMAGHLAGAGHDVTVYNRTLAKAEAWREQYAGAIATTPRAAAEGAEFVFTMVGNDDDLRAVVLGDEGAFAGMARDTILVDHTTVSAKVTHELALIGHDLGIHTLDAPVSGGQAGAENGVLSIMCGGHGDHFRRAQPIMAAYGKTIALIGAHGQGQMAKMVNQIAIAGVVQGLAEAMAFAKKAKLDGDTLLGVIENGAAGSWQMKNRGRTMLAGAFDFGFAVDWMRKDLAIALEEGRRLGVELEIARRVDEFYAEIQEMGGGRLDTSSLMRRLTEDKAR